MIESDVEANESGLLVQPCIVYLPVKSKVKDTIVAKFRLKPVATGSSKRASPNLPHPIDNHHDNQEDGGQLQQELAAENVATGLTLPLQQPIQS